MLKLSIESIKLSKHKALLNMETKSEIKEISMTSVMIGFSMIESIFSLQNPEIVAFFLNGQYDDDIIPSFFYKVHDRLPESIEEAQQCESTMLGLNNLKYYVRAKINQLEQQEKSIKQAESRIKEREVKQNFKAQNNVSEFGTVSEISDKYGLSKKQVRELKRDGKLQEFINNQDS